MKFVVPYLKSRKQRVNLAGTSSQEDKTEVPENYIGAATPTPSVNTNGANVN